MLRFGISYREKLDFPVLCLYNVSMCNIKTAKQILSETETSLRQLMEEGLKQQRYADVAEIANLAEGVARLLRGQGEGGSKFNRPTGESPRSRRKPAAAKSNRGKPKRDYPKFERDGDKLVKVGWSKKNMEEYEHRVTKETATEIVRHLANHVTMNEVFAIDEVLPVQDLSGAEVPSYQVYLILAWFRQVGVVAKKGRDGYMLLDSSLADGRLEALWNGLKERAQ